jgi:osomolarity two-component system response regulator SKN7
MLEKHLIHLKTVQKMDEIPKALGLPPLSEDVMQSVLSATAASAHSMGASSALGTEGANPMAAMMGYGPEMLRASQDAANGGFAGLGEDDSLVNPLAGMGFSDEEYISMLQNLIAAGAVSDSARGENADSVANVMGVARGEGVGAMSAGNGTKSKEGTPQSTRGSMPPPQGIVRKRPADAVGVAAESNDAAKKSRFTELPV